MDKKGRIILLTGKGGVGKTSVAAATALRSAEMGHKTLVISTDAAHSLADSLDMPLEGEPRLVAPNLWGQETDMSQALRTHWGTIREWVSSLLAWRGMEEIVADEMAVLPGMEELANLLYVLHYYESGQYDVLVLDCAPTGETLRLLSFPEIMHWWVEKLFPIERKAVSVVRPLVKALTNIPVPEDKVFVSIETLFSELERMHRLLTDPAIASVRLVVNAEKMVIKEAQRTYTYLNLYGYATDLIVCNRLIPPEVEDRYFASWKKSQLKHYQAIEEAFDPLPIRTIPLFDQEVVGLEMLRLMGRALYGEEDPTKIYYQGKAHHIRKVNGYYILSLSLPFLAKSDISLTQAGDELIVQAGRYRRNFILPRTLVGLSIAEAKFEEDKLHIKFNTGKARSSGKKKPS